jgi:hypothetical protein
MAALASGRLPAIFRSAALPFLRPEKSIAKGTLSTGKRQRSGVTQLHLLVQRP